jgi:hypothetical protein
MNVIKPAPPLIPTFAARPRRAVVAAGVAVLAVSLWVVSAVAGVQPSFGGGDAGANQAASGGFARAVDASVTRQGITSRITGVVADDTRTVIGMVIEGHDEYGDTVFPLGRSMLADQDGRTYAVVGGSADQADRRQQTLYFEAVSPTATDLTLTLKGLEFMKHADTINGRIPTPTRIQDQWALRFHLDGGVLSSTVVEVSTSPRPLGSGSVTIDRVQQSPTGTVISGHLSGFSMDEVPEMLLSGNLASRSGSGVALTGLHMGYGPNRELFELRFPRTTGAVTIQLAGGVTSQPHDATPAASLGSKLGGNPAEWSVTLPE